MYDNFSFNVTSAGQQCNLLIQPTAYQTQLPINQNVKFLPNIGQPMPQVVENLILHQVTPSIQSYPAVNLINQTQVFLHEFVSQGVLNVKFQDLSCM